jgi:hypothetical protein
LRRAERETDLRARVEHQRDADQPVAHRLQPELLAHHLEQRMHGPQQHAVKLALDDVELAEVVKVDADHVE